MNRVKEELAYIPEVKADKLISIKEFSCHGYLENDHWEEVMVVVAEGKLILIEEIGFNPQLESLARLLLEEKIISLLKNRDIKTYRVNKIRTL